MTPIGRESASSRRQTVVLGLALLLAVPAGVLRLACVGNSCDPVRSSAALPKPFCSLPPEVRRLVAAGYRDGRSPDVLAVTTDRAAVEGGTGMWESTADVPWPSLSPDARVPIVFTGRGIREDAIVPPGTSLAQIAPTLSEALGLRRPFPEVPSGRTIEGLVARGRPKLVVEIALKGLGSAELAGAGDRWSFVRSLMDGGAGTTGGTTGSVPLDPAAVLTTMGTGGLPAEHGITGALLRNESGALVRAWGRDAPLPVISTLPEDLDRRLGEAPLVGLVATEASDRGIVGGAWYPRHDRDVTAISKGPLRTAQRVEQLLTAGFGSDEVPDLLGVVMQASPDRAYAADAAIERILRAARDATAGSVLFVIAGTGSTSIPAVHASRIQGLHVTVEGRNLVEASAPGGLFLDRRILAASGLTAQVARDALLNVVDDRDQNVMADSFQGFAVSFGRYC